MAKGSPIQPIVSVGPFPDPVIHRETDVSPPALDQPAVQLGQHRLHRIVLGVAGPNSEMRGEEDILFQEGRIQHLSCELRQVFHGSG